MIDDFENMKEILTANGIDLKNLTIIDFFYKLDKVIKNINKTKGKKNG